MPELMRLGRLALETRKGAAMARARGLGFWLDFKSEQAGLALVLVEPVASRAAGTKTLYQWLHGGYMTSRKRKSPARWLG